MEAPSTLIFNSLMNSNIRNIVVFTDLIVHQNYHGRQYSPLEFTKSNIDLEIIIMEPDTTDIISYKVKLLLDEDGISTISFIEPFKTFKLMTSLKCS